MPFLQDPLAILAVLMLNIIISEQLAKLPYLRAMGTALIIIIITAITANLELIPASVNSPSIYDGIFTYLAPISIFYLLLTVNLKGLKRAGTPMVGVIVAMWVVGGPKGMGPLFYAVGGMFAGTHTGGSSNLNVIALHYGVNKEGNVYAATIATDNIVTALWMGVTLVLPPLLNTYFPRRPTATPISDDETRRYEQEANDQISDVETVNPQDLAILIGLGVVALYAAQLVANYVPAIPKILVLTTLALILAQVPLVQRLRGVRVVGIFCIYLFLAVIGAFCDLGVLAKDGQQALTMLTFVSISVPIHALFQFGIGGLLKQDWDVLGIASQANIGGSASCLALSKSLNRPDLHLPGILAGALGNAIGTYCGILVAEYLR